MRVFLSLACLLLAVSSITAITVGPETISTGLVPTEIDTIFNFDAFDGTLGTLNSIVLTVTVTGSFDISLTNSAATSQNVKATSNSDISVFATIFASPPTVSVTGTTGLQTLTPGQTLPFTNLPGNAAQTFTVTYTGGAMSNFIGADPLTVPIRFVSLSGLALSGGGGNIQTTQATRIKVDGDLSYIYSATVTGDPQFAGFQGQQFQFHGLPDTVFNLVSSPELQMNSQFVYIASGICNYNNTACFSHAGTYLGQIGVAIGSQTFTIVAGPHSKGLSAFVQNGADRHAMIVGAKFSFTTQHGEMSISHPDNSHVEIRSPNFMFNIINSDSFFNLEASLLDTHLLHTGAKKHNIKHCKDSVATEASLMKHYPIKNYIHGLVGQTWRAVTFCDQPFQGVVGDYIASDLHSNDYRYNYFNATE